MTDLFLLLGGFAFLIIGGELLVRGSVTIAHRFGMSPLLIGLTLVGFGTSAPELVTCVQASLAGAPGIAIGNIVGSNISNVLLVLGLSALVTPLAVSSAALNRDGVLLVVSVVMFILVGHFYTLDRIVGVAFLACLTIYIWFAYTQERGVAADGHTAAFEVAEAYDEIHDGPLQDSAKIRSLAERIGPFIPLLTALAGLGIIVAGGSFLVEGATGIARKAGISEAVIGLTIVAIGTSMPEFVTSIVAALRNHGDIAVGNLIGSSIYNILAIGGTTALITPTIIPEQIIRFDNFVMLAACLLMLVLARTGRRISRLEGLMLFAGYVAYIAVLWPKNSVSLV
jgi:cation:H+ antiporter